MQSIFIGLGGEPPAPMKSAGAGRPTESNISELIALFGQPQPFVMPCRMLDPVAESPAATES